MDKESFVRFFRRHLQGELRPGEQRELFRQLEKEECLEWVRELVREEMQMPEDGRTEDKGMEDAYERVLRQLQYYTGEESPKPGPLRLASWLNRAAAIFLLLSVCLAAYLYYQHRNPVREVPDTAGTPDLLPGRNYAVLTLANGRQVLLDELQVGAELEKGGGRIRKTDEGTISHIALSETPDADTAFNTIRTPRGGQFRIVLPDGTKVWLNAASELRYPSIFGVRERRVELTGEAYFEVSHDTDRPFLVKSAGQELQVLGTRFNVLAYPDEPALETTLLDGAVKIAAGNQQVLLRPGQQSRLSHGSGNIDVLTADTMAVVAWKDGRFIFNKEKLPEILRRISRWYDAEIVYEGETNGSDYIGTISRFEQVSEVLELLELTGTVRFRIETSTEGSKERRIIVMP